MKKMIIAALIAVSFTTIANAKTIETEKAATTFKADYAAAEKVEWKVSKDLLLATFEINGEKKQAFYTVEGTAVEASAKAFDKLPEQALRNITHKYQFPKYTLTACNQLTDEDGNVGYFLSFEKNGKQYGVKVNKDGLVGKMQRIKVSK